ncbi:glycosyltransferase [Candidatus Daviesbacteria bacterium]|nr:glycosyltransferase [Candidatus Daviesbacteria bacterium]
MSYSKTIIDLAVIIPALNEERFIGRLLDSIASQTVIPQQLVVVDAYSKDKTIAEIKKRQMNMPSLQYFRISKYTVARQRNFGVKKTISPHLLFLDADMELREKNALEKYFNEVLTRKPDVAAASNLPDTKHWKDSIYFTTEDLLFRASKYFFPVITARNLYIKRAIFNKVGGFDEEIAVGEDSHIVNKIVSIGGELLFLKSVKLYTSTRRIEQEGRRKYALKMIMFGFNLLVHGFRRSRVEYEFGHFTKPKR